MSKPPPGAPPRLSVVIPAFNESARLIPTLEATERYLCGRGEAFEILVVDDGSGDDTRAVAISWARGRSTIHVLGYAHNRGKGHAVRYGVLRAAGDRVLYMDADLATPIEELETLGAALDTGVDVALGSRPLRESRLLVHQPWYREAAGRSFNVVVQLLATPGILDTQCGFKLLTRSAARDIFARSVLDGFAFDIEVVFLARRLGYTVAEIPVRWAHQAGSAVLDDKLSYLRSGLGMVADVARIRWVHRAVRPLPRLSAPKQA